MRGRPVGGPGDRAGLPDCADAARSRPVVGAVAPARGSHPRSTRAPGSRTRRWRTPCRTRGTGACATRRCWPSPRPGCRMRLGGMCRWTGGRAALSGRATARGRGARTACAAPRLRGPETGDLGDRRVSRSWATAATHTRRPPLPPGRNGVGPSRAIASGRRGVRVWRGRYQPSVAWPCAADATRPVGGHRTSVVARRSALISACRSGVWPASGSSTISWRRCGRSSVRVCQRPCAACRCSYAFASAASSSPRRAARPAAARRPSQLYLSPGVQSGMLTRSAG